MTRQTAHDEGVREQITRYDSRPLEQDNLTYYKCKRSDCPAARLLLAERLLLPERLRLQERLRLDQWLPLAELLLADAYHLVLLR